MTLPDMDVLTHFVVNMLQGERGGRALAAPLFLERMSRLLLFGSLVIVALSDLPKDDRPILSV